MSDSNWECISADERAIVSRAEVPGGWLYRTSIGGSVSTAFVPRPVSLDADDLRMIADALDRVAGGDDTLESCIAEELRLRVLDMIKGAI